MSGRYLLMLLLFVAAAATPAVVRPAPSAGAAQPQELEVPAAVLDALRQGRFFRASKILQDYLAVAPDTAPGTILLTAEAAAGWGDWPRVDALLSGQEWLDSLNGGYGWSLLGRSRVELGRYREGSAALDRYLSVAQEAAHQERGLAEIRRARALTETGRHDAALEAYAQARELLPQLEDWIALYAARTAAEAGDTAAVRRLLDETEPRLAQARGWALRVDALEEAGDSAAALRTAESATSTLGTAAARAGAWHRTGVLRLARGDTAAAKDAFRRAMQASAGSRGAVDAARAMSPLALDAEERLQVGRLYLRHGNMRRAIRGLSAYLETGEGSVLKRGQVRLELGRAYFGAGRYREAERTLLALAESPPSARIGAEASFQAGRAQYRQGRTADGQATFLRTAERFPAQEAAAEALYLLADLYHDDQRLEDARRYYRRSTEMPPSINEVGLAWMRLGGIAFLDGDYAEALEVYEAYRERFPDGRRWPQATYWAGRVLAELGDSAAAAARMRAVRDVDPLDYYGIRAARWLDEPAAALPLEPSPPYDPDIEAEIAAAVGRVDLLSALDDGAAVAYEIERLQDHFSDRDGALYALAEALNARGHTFTGVLLGWDIREREGAWNPRLLRIVYPYPYREIIEAEAEERGLDPFLVAGLIRRESMFDADVVSSAGAIGLMQIVPRTGAQLARAAGIRNFRPSLLEKPEVNIHLGTQYFAELMRRYEGRLPAVLAAYNAGPHRMSRWRDLPEYRDMDLFAERIPFGETRNYVRFVQEHAHLYAMLYGDGPGTLGE